MKNYPKYGEPGFHKEYWFIHDPAKTAEDAHRQLSALFEIERNSKYYNAFLGNMSYSKRCVRIFKTWRAFNIMERNAKFAKEETA